MYSIKIPYYVNRATTLLSLSSYLTCGENNRYLRLMLSFMFNIILNTRTHREEWKNQTVLESIKYVHMKTKSMHYAPLNLMKYAKIYF